MDMLKAVCNLLCGWSGGGLHSKTTCPALGLEAPQALER